MFDRYSYHFSDAAIEGIEVFARAKPTRLERLPLRTIAPLLSHV
jgi:hypothetical protein